MPSVAVITYDSTPIPFAALATPQSVVMTSASSTPQSGTINYWRWYLLDKPPGSTASLLNSTTATCTLQNINIPGNHRVFLIVRDSAGNFSFGSPNPIQASSDPFAFTSPPASAFATIVATTKNKALQLTAYGERNWFTNGYWPVVRAVDEMYGLVSTVSTVTAPFSKWIQAHDGLATADGSISRPFNPVSATAEGFDGPWGQGIAALAALDVSEQPYVGRTINVLGGTYEEDVSIVASEPFNIICHGQVQIGVLGGTTKTFTYEAVDSGDTFEGSAIRADLFIGGMGPSEGGTYFIVSGNARLKNATAFAWFMRLVGIYVGGTTAVNTTFATGPSVRMLDCRFASSFNIPNLDINDAINCIFSSSVTARRINHAFNASFGAGCTTTAASTKGYFGCYFIGSTPVFTGIAGSAVFDPLTAASFVAVAGTFSGGAGLSDALKVGDLRSAAAAFNLKALSGTLNIEAKSPGSGTQGSVNITALANGYIGNVAITADNGIAITAADDLGIESTAGGAYLTGGGGVFLRAMNASKRVEIVSEAAQIELEAATSISLTTTDGNVVIDANGTGRDVVITADDQVTSASVGQTIVTTSGAGANITLQTVDAAIILDARGSSRPALITAAGYMDLAVTGANGFIGLTTADGNITLDANGTGRDVIVTADDGISLTATGAATIAGSSVAVIGNTTVSGTLSAYTGSSAATRRVATKLYEHGTAANPPSTALFTFDSHTLPANFFTNSGDYVSGEAYFLTAATANNKRMGIYVGGVKTFAVDETDNAFNSKKLKFEFKLWKTGFANILLGWYRVSWSTAKVPTILEEVISAFSTTTSATIAIEVKGEATVANTDITYLGWSLTS